VTRQWLYEAYALAKVIVHEVAVLPTVTVPELSVALPSMLGLVPQELTVGADPP
jgi:hypothetical protein